MITAKSFSSFNNQIYKNSKNYGNPSLSSRLKIMATLVDKNQKVLDLGCGTGDFIKILNKKNKEVEGIEISKKVAQIGQKKGFKIKIADLHSTFPYPKNTFDTVTAGEIIEHIYDTDFFLKEIKRILKPNGFLVLSTPNIATLGRRLMLLFGFNPLIETSLDHSAGHIRYFTKKSLSDLLEKHNFKLSILLQILLISTKEVDFKAKFWLKPFPLLVPDLLLKL